MFVCWKQNEKALSLDTNIAMFHCLLNVALCHILSKLWILVSIKWSFTGSCGLLSTQTFLKRHCRFLCPITYWRVLRYYHGPSPEALRQRSVCILETTWLGRSRGVPKCPKTKSGSTVAGWEGGEGQTVHWRCIMSRKYCTVITEWGVGNQGGQWGKAP